MSKLQAAKFVEELPFGWIEIFNFVTRQVWGNWWDKIHEKKQVMDHFKYFDPTKSRGMLPYYRLIVGCIKELIGDCKVRWILLSLD